jgi:hypothetical protein
VAQPIAINQPAVATTVSASHIHGNIGARLGRLGSGSVGRFEVVIKSNTAFQVFVPGTHLVADDQMPVQAHILV